MRALFVTVLLIALVPSGVSAQSSVASDVHVREGRVDLARIRESLARGSRWLRACYERAVAGGMRVSGRLDVHLSLRAGRVLPHAAVARRTFDQSPELEDCLLNVLRTLTNAPHDAPSELLVSLTLVLPPPAPVVEDPRVLRAEALSARAESRCLARVAQRLERIAAAWERAPHRREPLARALLEARQARNACSPQTLRALVDAAGTNMLLPSGIGPCQACIGADPERR
jgi:hypothetical protein